MFLVRKNNSKEHMVLGESRNGIAAGYNITLAVRVTGAEGNPKEMQIEFIKISATTIRFGSKKCLLSQFYGL